MKKLLFLLISSTLLMAGQYENKKVAVQNMMYDQCMNGGFGRDTCVCVAQKADITSGNTLNSIYAGSISKIGYQMILGEAYKQCGQKVTFN